MKFLIWFLCIFANALITTQQCAHHAERLWHLRIFAKRNTCPRPCLLRSCRQHLQQIIICDQNEKLGVAASISLRRKGFRKTGFFIQLVGPVIYIVPLVVESIIINFFR